MKAKTQVRIGSYTAVVSIASIVIFFPLYIGVSRDILWLSFVGFLHIIIFPSAYALALIIKKLKIVRGIFLLWCAAWVISFILICFRDVMVLYYWVHNSALSCQVHQIATTLELIVLLPTFAWFCILHQLLYSYFEPSPVMYAACGWLFGVLLWTGMRGLRKMVVEDSDQKQ